ncbi:hypothetical protein BGX24_003711, partial [Mortierella sp. AD032]
MPRHINFGLTLMRTEQIKRYLHVSGLPFRTASDPPSPCYYDKVQPLLGHIQAVSMLYYVPRSNVAVDEMIVRFGGRSHHIFRIKSKPIPVGYKILALCDAGYTYSFLPESCVQKNLEVNDQAMSIEDRKVLSETARKVILLIEQLPIDKES